MSTPPTEQNESETQIEVAENDSGLDARIRLGEHLSQARKSSELGLNEVSERLRIHKTYLAALESGDWSALPEEVYAIGFLRQYSALLGLDVGQEIEALKSGEYRLTKPFTIPDPPIAMSRTWALAAAACFLLLLILFNVIDEDEKGKSEVPVVAPGETINQQPVTTDSPNGPPAVIPQAAVPVAGNVPAAPAGIVSSTPRSPAESTPPPSPATTVTTRAAPSVAENAPESNKTAAGSSPVSVTAVPEQAMPQAPSGTHVYRLTAVGEDVWLQLYDPKGKLLKEVLLRNGQSMDLNSAADYLLLTAGNPQHLSLSIDGEQVAAAGSLGEKDKVLHDFRFQLPETSAVSGH